MVASLPPVMHVLCSGLSWGWHHTLIWDHSSFWVRVLNHLAFCGHLRSSWIRINLDQCGGTCNFHADVIITGCHGTFKIWTSTSYAISQVIIPVKLVRYSCTYLIWFKSPDVLQSTYVLLFVSKRHEIMYCAVSNSIIHFCMLLVVVVGGLFYFFHVFTSPRLSWVSFSLLVYPMR